MKAFLFLLIVGVGTIFVSCKKEPLETDFCKSNYENVTLTDDEDHYIEDVNQKILSGEFKPQVIQLRNMGPETKYFNIVGGGNTPYKPTLDF